MRSAGVACILLFALTEVLPAQTGSALTQYRRGEKLFEEGDLSGALRAFQQAYAIDPEARRGERVGMHFEDYDPAFQLGRLHARLGDFEEAEKFLEEAAKSRYTERSGNAEEFRRWRAVVERALSAARARPPTAVPAQVPPSPLPSPGGRGRSEEPSPTPVPVAAARPSPQARLIRLSAATPTPAPAAIAPVSPHAEPTLPAASPAFLPSPSAGESEGSPLATGSAGRGQGPRLAERAAGRAGGEGADGAISLSSNLLLPLLLIASAGGLFLFLLLRARRRRPQKIGEGAVPFGRYAITGLLGAGRSSFVYEARDRGEAVALRLRRPDLPAAETDRFSREAEAMEHARRPGPELPVPKLLARGVKKTGRGGIEYLAMEKLSGRSLLALSRRARRRLDPALSVEILREVVLALRRLRGLGLAHEELAAEDIYLVEPVPTNAGNAVRLKIFGLTAAAADPARDALALEAIAAELFRGRTDSWDQDEWVAQHVPAALRAVLVRVRESRGAPGSSFDDVEKALNEVTKPPRGAA